MTDENYGFYLPDGTYEPMLDPENDMARLIFESFGADAEICFKAILSNYMKKHFPIFQEKLFEACWDAEFPIYEIRAMLCCDAPNLDEIEKSLSKAQELIGQIEELVYEYE